MSSRPAWFTKKSRSARTMRLDHISNKQAKKQNQFREERMYLTYNSRLLSIIVEISRQEFKTFTVKSRGKRMHACLLASLLFICCHL